MWDLHSVVDEVLIVKRFFKICIYVVTVGTENFRDVTRQAADAAV